MEENGLALPLQKRILVPPNTKGPKKFEIFPAHSYKIRKTFLAPLDATYEIPLDMSLYIFNCNKTAEAIILKCL